MYTAETLVISQKQIPLLECPENILGTLFYPQDVFWMVKEFYLFLGQFLDNEIPANSIVDQDEYKL